MSILCHRGLSKAVPATAPGPTSLRTRRTTMRVLIAPDKFAGTLSAAEAANCIAEGWLSRRPHDEVILLPMADGGEGTLDAVAAGLPAAVLRTCRTHDPLGRPITARWLQTGDLAVIEAAEACGLNLLSSDERLPLQTTSQGVGELIRTAIEEPGVRELVVGLGGTATIDGGVGMARALGARFLNEHRDPVNADQWWDQLASFDPTEALPTPLTIASDVRNPLLGPTGAARVFGPQKGAARQDIDLLETALTRLADVVEAALAPATLRGREGTGAAGGIGFMLMALGGGPLVSGAELIAGLVGLPEAVHSVDIVITGEGSLDQQTTQGKAPDHVARCAREAGTWVGAVVGQLEPGAERAFDAVTVAGPDGLQRPSELVTKRAAELTRALGHQPYPSITTCSQTEAR